MKLNPNESAATILQRVFIGKGYCAGPQFPGDTIRKAFAKLEKIGALSVSERGNFVVTPEGKDWLFTNHLNIKG